MYAKLINGNLVTFRNPIRLNGMDIFTTDPRPYGYKTVDETAPEEREGYHPVHDGWREDTTTIYHVWRYEENTPTTEDRLSEVEDGMKKLLDIND